MSKGSQRRPTDETKFRENYERIFWKPPEVHRGYAYRYEKEDGSINFVCIGTSATRLPPEEK